MALMKAKLYKTVGKNLRWSVQKEVTVATPRGKTAPENWPLPSEAQTIPEGVRKLPKQTVVWIKDVQCCADGLTD